jgi:hypothetical protein
MDSNEACKNMMSCVGFYLHVYTEALVLLSCHDAQHGRWPKLTVIVIGHINPSLTSSICDDILNNPLRQVTSYQACIHDRFSCRARLERAATAVMVARPVPTVPANLKGDTGILIAVLAAGVHVHFFLAGLHEDNAKTIWSPGQVSRASRLQQT